MQHFSIIKAKTAEGLYISLVEQVGDYHEAVLVDEVHAWLMNNEGDLQAVGLDTKPYQDVIQKLQAIFKKYDRQ